MRARSHGTRAGRERNGECQRRGGEDGPGRQDRALGGDEGRELGGGPVLRRRCGDGRRRNWAPRCSSRASPHRSRPAAAQTALLQAIDQKPDLIIGFPSSAQIIALQPTIKSSGIPFLGLSSGEQLVANGPYGAPNLFLIRPVDTLVAVAETNYVLDTLKAKKIGLECVDNATGVNGCNAAIKVIGTKKGASVFTQQNNTTTDTDLTEQARAMQGADVVLDFNFPNPLGVMSNALVANGVNVPHVDGASASIIAGAKVVQGPAATNLNGADDCVPVANTNKRVTKWVSDFTAKFGYAPIYSAAQTYDMVNFAAAIAAKQQCVTPKAMLKGLATQDVARASAPTTRRTPSRCCPTRSTSPSSTAPAR